MRSTTCFEASSRMFGENVVRERDEVSEKDAPGAVFDCMVFFQAASRPGGPSARLLLEFVETGRLELYVSGPILEEVRDVLSRPRVRAKNPAITDESVNAFLERSERLARRFDDVPSVYSLARDPDDEPYLNLALAANAEYLVTWDNNML